VELLRLLKVSPYGLPECKVRSALLSTLKRAENSLPINLPEAQRKAKRIEAVEDALAWCKIERYVELFNNPVLDDANRRALDDANRRALEAWIKAGGDRALFIPAGKGARFVPAGKVVPFVPASEDFLRITDLGRVALVDLDPGADVRERGPFGFQAPAPKTPG
jgi:hypothetical protein